MATAMATEPAERMTEDQAAEYLGVSKYTLQCWRSTGRYSVTFVKIGRLVRYEKKVLDKWLESRVRQPEAT